jgi:glutathione synthase/RimK-type ligase-like ATP-grasp enzyme
VEQRHFKIKDFNKFINENYLSQVFQRFYMLVRKPFPLDSENLLGRMIGEARDVIFDQVAVDASNYKMLPIQQGVPILNFTEDNDLVEKMLKEKLIDETALYNKPQDSSQVSDKVSFHMSFMGSKFVPKTVFSVKETKDMKFPVIAKPSVGKSAEGIKKFDNYEDLESTEEKFDVFSEAIEIEQEYRCFCFKDQIIELNKRVKVKGADDFLKDASTKTDFIYQDVNLKKYDKIQKVNELIEECKKRVSLEFFSIDYAEDSSGELFIIEMNSRTGMGVDKMAKLYRLIYEDFYKKEPDAFINDKLSKMEEEWEKAYSEEKDNSVNECTVVGGKLEDKMFLFKNRDRSYTPESRVIREKIDNVEVVYYTDQTGWVEGMNEHGVGFVFSALTSREYVGYDPSYYMSDEPKSDSKFDRFRKGILKVLSSKSADQAVDRILSSKKSGNFIVSDKKTMIELEVFEGKNVRKDVDVSNLKIKTNHGELIPQAGHQQSGYGIKRSISSIRKHQATVQLEGVKKIGDIPTRMKFQAFDGFSPLNTFRTDPEEHTISQCLMNLTDGCFYFFHDEATADGVSFKGTENGKITVQIFKI